MISLAVSQSLLRSSLSWLTYATDIYLEYVEPELAPEVTILWLCEPDNSYHYRGIGSAENLAAIRHADMEFGRIIASRDASGMADRLQVITISDHGQLTISGEAIELGSALTAAGFIVGEVGSECAQMALALGGSPGIYLRDPDPRHIDAVVTWLQDQPWCGPLFTRHGRGCLTLRQVGLDHPRAPDIALVLRSDNAPNGHGPRGTCCHDSRYPAGGGTHGGLHPIELATWFAASGIAFLGSQVSNIPAGIVDILPTVLHLLGIEAPPGVQGRVLRETLVAYENGPPPVAEQQIHSAESSAGIRTHLSVSRIGRTSYLDRAWVD